MQWLPITTRSASCSSRPSSCTVTIVPGRDDLLVTADRGEAVGAAERRHAAGALAHGIGRERASGVRRQPDS